MTDFNHILNWKLQTGSHDFPGLDGGTCINEAAIVAAGFKYRRVQSAIDCPPCFSPPISSYAIYLNDRMPDHIRNELLMPFVTRLSGTADTNIIEKKRYEFIVVQISRRIIGKKLASLQLPSYGFVNAQTLRDVRKAASALAAATFPARSATVFVRANVLSGVLVRALDLARAILSALDLAMAIDLYRRYQSRVLWTDAVSILDEAILLGNHPDPIDQGLVIERMDKIRETTA